MRALPYHLSRLAAALLFAPLVKIRCLRPELGRREGAWILAANHISHFDPPLLGIAVRREVDWMGMVELFRIPVFSGWLRGIGSFPVDRARLDRRAVREAIARLRAGHVLGMFPEGGIRDGPRSVMEGAPMRHGVAALAQLTGAPVIPCVIIGSDRLYALPRHWRPGRRIPIWIAFGEPLLPPSAGQESAARALFESSIAGAFVQLTAEMRRHFALTEDDLPRSAAIRRAQTQ